MRDPDIDWRALVAILYRRRHTILRVFVAGIALVLLATFAIGPSYEATATLLVTPARTRSISPDASAAPTVDRVTDEDLNSQAALIDSRDLIREVLQSYRDTDRQPTHGWLGRMLGLPLEAPVWIYRTLHGLPAPNPFERWVGDVARHLKVKAVNKTDLIQVSYKQRGINPAWAAEFVNALVDRSLAQHERLSQQSEAAQFFESQRQLLNDRVRRAEEGQREFYAREGLDSMPQQRAIWRSRLAELTVAQQGAEADVAGALGQVDSLRAEIRKYPKVIAQESRQTQNQAVQFIKPRILEKEIERSKLLSTYAPTSVKVRDVERELAEARRLLQAEERMIAETTRTLNPTHQTLEIDLAQARVGLASAQARLDTIHAQITEARQTLGHLDSIAAEQERLEQDVATAQEAFATYYRKQEQARLSSALDASRIVNVAIAQPAQVPVGPAKSYRSLLLALGGVTSLMAGIAVAFVFDQLDPSVRDATDAQGVTGLPVLAEIAV